MAEFSKSSTKMIKLCCFNSSYTITMDWIYIILFKAPKVLEPLIHSHHILVVVSYMCCSHSGPGSG